MKTYSLQTAHGVVDVSLRKHHFSKQLRLSIRNNRALITLPRHYPYKVAEKFAESKKDWITTKLSESKPLTKPSPKQRKQAEEITNRLISELSEPMNVHFKRVSIRNQASRWGSCSSTGTLSFNWRIIMLPDRLQRYLVIHELAHIKQPNHSSKFWDIVREFDDEYLTHRKQLKQIDLTELKA